ncbi:MAG: exodeoxyribonuclease III [Candidatus Moranbacteria bacterium]|nr:exodeoxyribonuclease III [Candidatus Moranbacteria bacterium]
MKIITWNVNGLRAVEKKGELESFLKKERPEILLLQETKGQPEQFTPITEKYSDFTQFYHSAEKKGYAGTAAWIKKETIEEISDVKISNTVPKNPVSDEGRVTQIDTTINKKDLSILSIYFPNGGKSPKAWEEKIIFFDRVLAHMNNLRKKGRLVIVGGDMNVAHTEIDLARPKENDGKIGFHPKERAWMDDVIKDDWTEVWRAKNPNTKDVYSYWDNFTRARERNVGWRIDYFLIDKKQLKKVERVEYLNKQLGSDHCPLVMEIGI